MDEIRALQEELRRAQQSGSAARLSERNCVQLIMKLQELGLLQVNELGKCWWGVFVVSLCDVSLTHPA